jgi:hypothetical protein
MRRTSLNEIHNGTPQVRESAKGKKVKEKSKAGKKKLQESKAGQAPTSAAAAFADRANILLGDFGRTIPVKESDVGQAPTSGAPTIPAVPPNQMNADQWRNHTMQYWQTRFTAMGHHGLVPDYWRLPQPPAGTN